MRLEIIQGLQFIIIAFLAYVPTVTISGWFEAWVAKKCGDDVPQQFGFLTLDPLVHFNILGFGCLLAGTLLGDYLPFFKGIPGWGKYVPINPSSNSIGRTILQCHARAIAHFGMVVVALFSIIQFIKFGHANFAWAVSTQASTSVTSAIALLQFFFQQNILLCIIYMAIGTFRTIMTLYFPDFYIFSSQNLLWGILILFGSVIICSEIYRMIIAKLLMLVQYLLIA